MRQSVMAFSAVDQKLKGQKEVLLPILWAAWRELVEENQRDQHMDITQRLYEEEAKKAQQEAQQLKVEASQLRQRHLHTQQKRQAVFLMSLEQRDQTLLLQVTMSAWRECVEDRRKHAVNEMRKQFEAQDGRFPVKAWPGTVLAILPAHVKMLSLRSADGVSPHTLLLTNIQQMLAAWNMLVLKYPQLQKSSVSRCLTTEERALSTYVSVLAILLHKVRQHSGEPGTTSQDQDRTLTAPKCSC
eukprot:g20352.t1